MSQHLHSYLDAERLADCAANDKALTDASRAVLSADAKMTASRSQPVWMRPQPMTPVMAIRARGLGLLAGNDEPESMVNESAPADLQFDADVQELIQGQGFIGGLPS